jgi:hypothetical protein
MLMMLCWMAMCQAHPLGVPVRNIPARGYPPADSSAPPEQRNPLHQLSGSRRNVQTGPSNPCHHFMAVTELDCLTMKKSMVFSSLLIDWIR